MKKLEADTIIRRDGCDALLAIRHYPDRKNPALTIERGVEATLVAYFTGDKAAETFLAALGELCGTKEESNNAE